jgi:hypothetical protein
MQIKAHFVRSGHYRGVGQYKCYDDRGAYELEVRESYDPYEGGNWNYTPAEFERDVVGSVGFLHTRSGARICQETVDAFNAWRLAEHQKQMAKLDADPKRYGIIAAEDPWRTPPAIVQGGYWRDGWHAIG